MWIRVSKKTVKMNSAFLRFSSAAEFLFSVSVSRDLLEYNVVFQIYHEDVGRTKSLCPVLDILWGSFLFLSLLVLVLGSVNSKFPPPYRFILLLLISSSRSIDSTLSLPFLSGLLGAYTFPFKLLSNLNRRFPCFVISSRFSNNQRVSGLLSL